MWVADKVLQDIYGEEVKKVSEVLFLLLIKINHFSSSLYLLLTCRHSLLIPLFPVLALTDEQAQAAEARQKAMVTATKNDDSESNLSVDSSSLTGKQEGLIVAMDQHIANITRPATNILLFFSMCIHIHDLESNVLSAAKKWLDLYDDETRAYKNMRRKGLEMSDM